jgi:hypothetical protein
MASSHAAPESKTPETLVERLEHFEKHQLEQGDTYGAEVLHNAATALSLTQAEIKGHMRIEDDLKAELRIALDAAMRWYVAASPYATPGALREALDEAQARVAEFEKMLDQRRGNAAID